MAAVNEALNELYIEDEDHDKLRESVDDYDNFDQVNIIFTSVLLYIFPSLIYLYTFVHISLLTDLQNTDLYIHINNTILNFLIST